MALRADVLGSGAGATDALLVLGFVSAGLERAGGSRAFLAEASDRIDFLIAADDGATEVARGGLVAVATVGRSTELSACALLLVEADLAFLGLEETVRFGTST